ncbi:MAG: type II toxin-antitoxin system PemK/MazF family toxin [Eggerthellaceae bacterium]|jgi:mRNA interferase MazF|nr:type II toxin-antitoxin system PemK/MazF family toxin [Eggerthellaceae bacterium]MDR2721991.1 type II toxin-antitoxin system PemK/MazF family toxin [Coriobacteriaceae bacterium]
MKRGEVWTLRDDGYASKARPVVVVQADSVAGFDSVVLCLFTTFKSDDAMTRVFISAGQKNGLRKDSYVMTEKILTVSKKELCEKVGVLTSEQMRAISRQLAKILDIGKDDTE